VFLSLHSGALGMFMPYAYRDEPVTYKHDEMLSVLNALKQKFCTKCSVGQLSKIIYKVGGNCLDYAYECLGVPFAFAWEIYEDNSSSSIGQFTPTGSDAISNETKKWKGAVTEMANLIYDMPRETEVRVPSNECNEHKILQYLQ